MAETTKAAGTTARFLVEERAIQHAATRRREDFVTGRECAREALGMLGLSPAPIPIGPFRAAVWPEGYTGSITHTDGYWAAAAAPAEAVAALGIDAETNQLLAEDVATLVLSSEEMAESRPYDWSLIFSAKESVFKAWSSQNPGRWLDFYDVHLTVSDDRFSAFVRPDGANWTGSYRRTATHIFTCVVRKGSSHADP
ncbi:MAG TPA: 4'-phosphopantetheinyl transferase superfamily protein [Jiangellaceae bacterium]